MKNTDARQLSTELQQYNRDLAVRWFEEGRTQREIASLLNVHSRTIHDWITLYKKGGTQALAIKKRGRELGERRKLTKAQEVELRQMLIDHAPYQFGLNFALWTSQAIRTLIWKSWRVHIAPRTIRAYMQRWQFTPQKPLKQAYERDPKKVERWLEKDYPRIQARAKVQGATIFWADETGISNDPQHARGYAPKGQTPLLKHRAKRYRVNMISALDNRGKVRFMLYKESMTAKVLLSFFKRLIKDSERKVFVILDNLRVHHAKLVQQWLDKHKDEIEAYYLPAYSPDLNPDEYLNGDLKNALRASKPANNEQELMSTIRGHMRFLQKNPEHVCRYFHHDKIRYAA